MLMEMVISFLIPFTVITHVEQKLAELANRTEEEKEIEMEKQEKNRELAARVSLLRIEIH